MKKEISFSLVAIFASIALMGCSHSQANHQSTKRVSTQASMHALFGGPPLNTTMPQESFDKSMKKFANNGVSGDKHEKSK